MERLTPEQVIRCSNCGSTCLFKQTAREIVIIHSCWTQQQRDSFSALHSQIDLLAGALKPFADAEKQWMDGGSPQEICMDWMTAAREVLSQPAIAEHLAAEEALQNLTYEMIWRSETAGHDLSYVSDVRNRLRAAAERMWPKGERT